MHEELLRPTFFLDHESPQVRGFVADNTAGAIDEVARAVKLYYAVRDSIRYDPYSFSIDKNTYRSSRLVDVRRSFCVPKALLLASAGRAAGIPTRLGFADVRNHISTEKFRRLLGSDLFVFHGYAELWLGSKWVKATPAFNRELCDRFGVAPLEFDGKSDALLQPYDTAGRQYMEYVRDRGEYADLPFDEMVRVYSDAYGDLVKRLAGH